MIFNTLRIFVGIICAGWEKGTSEPTDKDVKKLQDLLKSDFKTSVHNELGTVTDQLS